MAVRKLVPLFLLFLLSTSPAAAAWSRAGLHGADVRALVIDPKEANTVYIGTSQGQIYASHDGAVSWENPRRGGIPFPGYIVDNLVIDPDGKLWAACWGLWGGGVVAFSDDGGETWTRRDKGLEEISIRAVAFDAKDANKIFVGGVNGVFRSVDGGVSWEKISDQINVESLAVDPRTSDTVYVGTWRQAWRTDDGGKTWKHINKGMVLDTDVFTITIDPKDPDNLWVSTCGWVYNSGDRGDNWTRYKEGFNNRRIHDIEMDPQRASCVYAGSVAGLYRTVNLGKSWELVTDESLVINAIGLHPDCPGRIILATEGDGIYLSQDEGKTFTRTSDGLYSLRVASIVADPQIEGRLYSAVVMGGAASGVHSSNDGGVSWQRLSTTKLPEIRSLVVQGGEQTRFLAGTEKGFYWSNDGVEWSPAEPLQPLRVEKILPYNQLRHFAATSEGVYTSKDSGRSWYRLATSSERTVDITVGRLGERRALYALTASGLVVFDGEQWSPIAGSPAQGRTVAAKSEGTEELLVIAGSQGVKSGFVSPDRVWIEAPSPRVAYASVYQTSRSNDRIVLLSSREPNDIMVADSARHSWRPVKLPIVSTEITSVSADPFNPQKIYVSTNGQGIYIYEEEPSSAGGPVAAGTYRSSPGSK